MGAREEPVTQVETFSPCRNTRADILLGVEGGSDGRFQVEQSSPLENLWG